LFRAENQAATLNKICLEPIPMPSSVDPALAVFDPILERGLARDPNLRFQSAEEFAEAIEEAAPMLGGLAKQREVAQLVREYASEKLNKDADLIRDAIAQLAANNPSEPASGINSPISSPEPPPPPSLPPPPRVFAPPPAAAAPNLVVPVPSGLPPLPPSPPTSEIFSQLREPLPMLDLEAGRDEAPSSKRWIFVAAVFTLAAAIGIAVLLSMRDDRVHPVPLPAATVEAPPPAPTAPLEPPPEATAAPVEPVKPAAAQHETRPERPSRRSSGEPRENGEPSAQPSETPPAEAAAPTPPPRETTPAPSAAPTTPRRRREIDTTPPTAPSRPAPPDDLLLNPYR
jgi:hypothetical protein